jgi:hypothetical protein
VVQEIPLSELELLTVGDVAALKGKAVRTVQKWILAGAIPVFVVGTGKRTVYLLRESDVKEFNPPPMGRPKAKPEKPKVNKIAAGRGRMKKGS